MPKLEPAPVIPVLYVGGVGRSGSTLLDRLLGQQPGWVSLGEVRDLWRRGVLEDRFCGCGVPFSECPMWRAVGELAYGGWRPEDARAAMALAARVDRLRRVPQLLVPRLGAGFRRDLADYASLLDRLYRAVAEVSGARVLVDSSKAPSYALALRHVPSLDLRVAHLVRDSRGMAYSWAKTTVRPDVDRVAYMSRLHPARSAGRWMSRNLLVEQFARLGIPTRKIRYEDLIEDPAVALDAVAGLVAADATTDWSHVVTSGQATLAAGHTVQGNPMRMQVGAVQLRADDAWRTEMPARHARLVTTLTWPLLRRYHYVGRRRG